MTYKRTGLMVVIVATLLLVVFASCTPASTQVKELKMATGTPQTSSVSPNIAKMAELMETYSDGAVKVKVYWAGEIAEVKDLSNLATSGAIDMMVVPPVHFASFYPLSSQLTMYSILLPDVEMAAYIWRGLLKDIPELQEEFEKQNQYLLNRIAIGPYLTLSKEPIRSKADFSGKKVRGMPGKYFSQMMEKAGATNISTISVPEIYEALMRGAVDVVMLIPQDFIDLKYYEIAEYVSLSTGCIAALSCSMNLDTWNSLSSKSQKAIIQAATEWGAIDLNTQLTTYDVSIDALKEKGVQFVDFNQDDWNAMLADAGDPWASIKNDLVNDFKVDAAVADKFVNRWHELYDEYNTKYKASGKNWEYE